jgi:hypothetical protein
MAQSKRVLIDRIISLVIQCLFNRMKYQRVHTLFHRVFELPFGKIVKMCTIWTIISSVSVVSTLREVAWKEILVSS